MSTRNDKVIYKLVVDDPANTTKAQNGEFFQDADGSVYFKDRTGSVQRNVTVADDVKAGQIVRYNKTTNKFEAAYLESGALLWETAEDLGSFNGNQSVSLSISAISAFFSDIDYTISEGTDFPDGFVLSGTTISGTVANITENTTLEFNLTAVDGISNPVNRTFTISAVPAP